jgi:hypothetical protein
MGQELVLEESSATHEVYLLSNPELNIAPYFELLIPAGQANSFSILEQDVQRISVQISDSQKSGFALISNTSLVEKTNRGIFRGNEVQNLLLHVARPQDDHVLVTRKLRIRIPKQSTNGAVQLTSRKSISVDSPLSSGQWFKIPILKQGLYQLDTSYLEGLGLNLSNIDPRNIQLWGTSGWMLPELNNVEKPELEQLPIIVEGEADGSFDESDRIIFFGNSPHQVLRNSTSFSHEIHPYSNQTFVFLTIGNSVGDRLTPTTLTNPATSTISSFTDFRWKEQELNKAEDRQRSGRFWLGQRIPATAQNLPISILRDTIPGIIPNQNIRVSGRIYSRALRTTSYDISLNSESVAQFSISSVSGGYLSYNGDAALGRTFNNIVSPSINDDQLEVELVMANGDDGANGFVDYIRLEYERELVAENGQLVFFPPVNSSPADLADFQLGGFNSLPLVFDVTNPTEPIQYQVSASGNYFAFRAPQDQTRCYIAQSNLYTPSDGVEIVNQNLKGLTAYPDYIIVTNEQFQLYADELAQYRINDGLTPYVVNQSEILNEFSGGVTDPTAIRNFLKFLWDRATSDGERLPRYLLLFGDTTYDTKGIVENSFTNHVLTYQSPNSLSRIGSYASDDFFGFMDENEGSFNAGSRIDIGIGRIPAQTRREARIALDKIYTYENPENAGDWQNLFTFSGDDDFPDETLNRDLHVWNADGTADRMNIIDSGLRLKKIYLFDYPEEITGSGRQVPAASADFISSINNGTLVMNYSGHGNTSVLSDEELFSIDHIPSLTNSDKLSIFVTATCQFGRYDDINAQSGAELLYFAENGGAIASFTTTRIVYTSSNPEGGQNFALNIALSEQMLIRDPDGRPSTLGDIYLRTKNTSAGSSSNSRRFILLGDPAIRLALPSKPAEITQINDVSLTESDTVLTIRALDEVTIQGQVNDFDGNLNTTYDGIITVNLLDAKRTVTLPQDLSWIEDRGCFLYRGSARECTYEVENNTLFKGSAIVENGEFSLTFILPKDLSFSPDQARIVLYASGNDGTAGGSFTNVVFNGINENAVNDGQGPNLDIFLNDESFFNGDLTTDKPQLIVELADSSGINATGTGVGHEITATIDTNPTRTIVLNEFYESALNDFSKGRIEYPLDEIPEGNYSLKVRAWDVHNNPSEETIFFEVAESGNLVVDQVYNYPNPMNNSTAFTFEHNQQGNALDVDIRIYTLSGRPVQHLQEYITNTSSSYASIPWDGRDRDNDRLGNGTYIYVLRVAADTPEGRKSTEKIEKLVIIR